MYDVKKLRDIKDSDEFLKYCLSVFTKQGGAALWGFVCSLGRIRTLSPFGVSASAAIFPQYIPAAVLGSAVGYLFLWGFSVSALRYMAAAAIGGIISYLLKKSLKPQYFRHFSALASFFALVSTGLVMSVSITLSLEEIAMFFAEGAVSGAAAYFLNKGININPLKNCASRLSGSETASVLVIFSVVLLSLKNFDIASFSPAVTAGVYAVLVTACYGGEKYGSLAGICAGAVLGFSSEASFITAGTALGGLLSGIFGRNNRFFASVIFILTLSVWAFSPSDPAEALGVLYSSGAAAVLFLASPKSLASFYKEIFSLSDDGVFLSGQRKVLKMRLYSAADSMNSVSNTVKALAGIYRKRTAPKKEQITINVCNKVCRKCSRYESCWQENGSLTLSYFERISDALKNSESLTEKDIPYKFFGECLEPEKVINAVSSETAKYKAAMRETVKTGETVNIVSDQFSSVWGLLNDFSRSMETAEEYVPELSELARTVLENDFDMNIISAGVFKNSEKKLYCEITLRGQKKFDSDAVCEALCKILDRPFEKPVIRRLSGDVISFNICEKTKYKVSCGGYQINSGDGKWCGDTFDSFFDGKGNFIMILSDGMGTGQKAAADSVLCCSLSGTLLKGGFPPDSIINVINSAMLVRSGEESLATMDIAVINLYNGLVEFYKAGASFSLVMKHFKLLKAEKPSLPLGILRNVAFEKISITVRDGDTVVMMSDGVTQKAAAMWRDILRDAQSYQGKELADKLAKTATLNTDKDSRDDITVLTGTLTLNI